MQGLLACQSCGHHTSPTPSHDVSALPRSSRDLKRSPLSPSPLEPSNLLLWFPPFLIGLAGGTGLSWKTVSKGQGVRVLVLPRLNPRACSTDFAL